MSFWAAIFLGITFAWAYNLQCQVNILKKDIENLKHKVDLV